MSSYILYRPLKENDGVWSCSFKVGDIEKKARGEDSMQALIISIDAIRRTLKELDDQLSWLEGSGFLGFPMFVPMYLSDQEIQMVEENLHDIEKKLVKHNS